MMNIRRKLPIFPNLHKFDENTIHLSTSTVIESNPEWITRSNAFPLFTTRAHRRAKKNPETIHSKTHPIIILLQRIEQKLDGKKKRIKARSKQPHLLRGWGQGHRQRPVAFPSNQNDPVRGIRTKWTKP